MDKILILDFGGQYNLLIARRIRAEQVYAEIMPYCAITPEEIRSADYKGIVFTGGPNSVYASSAPRASASARSRVWAVQRVATKSADAAGCAAWACASTS